MSIEVEKHTSSLAPVLQLIGLPTDLNSPIFVLHRFRIRQGEIGFRRHRQ
jgi:hypothetical protein